MSRIIAGRRGGHRLVMPHHDRTRPTSDLVRESAFNLIAGWAGTAGEPAAEMLERFSFLDLYAGSGAMGLEAASRGAGPVWAVEKDAATASVAKRNAATLELPVTVITAPVEAVLAELAWQPLDIVWLDPPYHLPAETIERVLGLLVAGEWLAADALVVVERARRDAAFAWPDAFRRTWSRRYGETTLYLGSPEADDASGAPEGDDAGESE